MLKNIGTLVILFLWISTLTYGGTTEQNAKLPTALQQSTIEDMAIGDTGWTVPWAMWADPQGNLWLNGKYTVHPHPGGTVKMQLLRTPRGFHIDITNCQDVRWTPSEPSFVGGALPIPVVQLSGLP